MPGNQILASRVISSHASKSVGILMSSVNSKESYYQWVVVELWTKDLSSSHRPRGSECWIISAIGCNRGLARPSADLLLQMTVVWVGEEFFLFSVEDDLKNLRKSSEIIPGTQKSLQTEPVIHSIYLVIRSCLLSSLLWFCSDLRLDEFTLSGAAQKRLFFYKELCKQ